MGTAPPALALLPFLLGFHYPRPADSTPQILQGATELGTAPQPDPQHSRDWPHLEMQGGRVSFVTNYYSDIRTETTRNHWALLYMMSELQ